ncbi:phosphoethanolamine transferase [Nautilia sp. PV-1]|uniref:phosphoethanolamine transferase n=1 Tax=Nautilia sp. PV-1 TaxID=2579250 RepID=UPI000FDB3130|nr:phosphoethanolamine--lipid A transferase [Nautilia sp. PV-1]AZV45945.1 phosphoethanolamine transferase [Nautilia sp. PV-1]
MKFKFKFNIELTQTQLIILSSLFFVLFENFVFFKKSYEAFHNVLFMLGLGGLLFVVISTLLILISNRYIIKPFLIVLFLVSSAAAYYMQAYGTIINDKMIQNIFETDTNEVKDLLNFTLFAYILFLGVLPSLFVYKVKIKNRGIKKEIISRLKLVAFNILLVPVLYLMFSKYWVSFFRSHKTLRMYTNPTYYIYSLGKYIDEKYFTKPMKFKHIGMDAKVEEKGKPKLVIFVLGEAARYDHFSLNGYKRDTNPNLEKIKDLIDFPDVHSCGTETAVSVPCMFSPYNRSDYSDKLAKHTDSVIDIINRAGVNVLWRDNDSGSKGVASRIKNYEDYNNANIKPYCKDGNCVDDVLLYKLQKWINDLNNSKPVFIVLHTKGSHGPAYYKRYPKSFEKFKPICKTNQLQDCKREEVVNAYDNTILYTDHFLDEVIKFLKKNEGKYRVAMYYMSDHGESLGENGIYLHGMPYFIAPDVQKHPASVAWFGKNFDINVSCVKKIAKDAYTQDNLFSTLLGLLDVKTKVYNPKMDIFYKCRIKK